MLLRVLVLIALFAPSLATATPRGGGGGALGMFGLVVFIAIIIVHFLNKK